MSELIDAISEHDRLLGFAALQMHKCAGDALWFPAAASLFLLMEQALRAAVDVDDKSRLVDVISDARDLGVITRTESDILDSFRKHRNSSMHSSFHGMTTFSPDGLLYWTGEEETAEAIYSAYSYPCMLIVYKIVSHSNAGI